MPLRPSPERYHKTAKVAEIAENGARAIGARDDDAPRFTLHPDERTQSVSRRLKSLTGNDEFREEFVYLLTRMSQGT